MRTLSSCKLSLMRALLFFSTRGFLICQNNFIPLQLSPLSIPFVLLRMGAMLLKFNPGATRSPLDWRLVCNPKSRYSSSMGQMAGRSQRPTKLAERLGSLMLLRGGMYEEQLVLPARPKKPFPTGLCCLTFGLVVFMSGLVLASIYVYRYYFIPQQIPEDSLFHCRVVFEDSVYAPLRGRQELEENVGIYLDDNYEQISVPVPHFGGSDPADIIHDFQRGLTAYHDIALDKCYITELNTTLVMPPRNLWELLVNVKRGTYLPQTYIIQEEMVVTGRVRNMRQLGPFIHRLCYGKETYRLRRRNQRRRIERRETKKCHSIRHFENTFVVETVICDRI